MVAPNSPGISMVTLASDTSSAWQVDWPVGETVTHPEHNRTLASVSKVLTIPTSQRVEASHCSFPNTAPYRAVMVRRMNPPNATRKASV